MSTVLLCHRLKWSALLLKWPFYIYIVIKMCAPCNINCGSSIVGRTLVHACLWHNVGMCIIGFHLCLLMAIVCCAAACRSYRQCGLTNMQVTFNFRQSVHSIRWEMWHMWHLPIYYYHDYYHYYCYYQRTSQAYSIYEQQIGFTSEKFKLGMHVEHFLPNKLIDKLNINVRTRGPSSTRRADQYSIGEIAFDKITENHYIVITYTINMIPKRIQSDCVYK